MAAVVAPAGALGSHVRHGRFDGYRGPRLIAPDASPQVLGIGDGAAVQQRALHERRGIPQGPRLARGQPTRAAVAERERRPLVEAEVPVRGRRFLLFPASGTQCGRG